MLSEQLGSLTRDWGGVSWVMQLDSAASARSELGRQRARLAEHQQATQHHLRSLPITTIPGAHGYHLGGTAGSFEGDNIDFSDGPFLYLVGNGWNKGTANTPPRANLIAAATKLHKRVHGHATT